ncbi:hypothetical protein [Bradyrhizobium erythrophlei]|uniref:Uncharacterized protein n=1 Tax=Bradyrhizobium erythrophlei TaxID=1437360 RepID=A0A1M5NMK6_9BRAD|nr:hypothetical protein [Bradyrhizobium erythrophlei]SHG90796.1 hypothetical protein SAMN05443248_3054 [Bradyrhizobium erythrophlei]
MMFFCSLMALVVSILMLCLLCDDLATRKANPSRSDYVVDAFMLVGFLCTIVLAFHGIIAALR